MSEHQVRDRVFKKYINCEQNYFGHAMSSAEMLNIWALHHLCRDWPWNSKRKWGKLHFIVIAPSLPSFSFTYRSGCSVERSSLGSARHGLPRSCPAFCWPGTFLSSFQDSPQQEMAPVSIALSSAHCCSARAQQRHGPEKTAEELGRVNLCVMLCGWSGQQGSWLSAPLLSYGRIHFFKRGVPVVENGEQETGQRCISNSSGRGDTVESPSAAFRLKDYSNRNTRALGKVRLYWASFMSFGGRFLF